MAKNLDGIKKLSSDEIKKLRQVVLNYIGEKDEPAVEDKQIKTTLFARKKVDGLNVNKIDPLEAAVKRQEEERRKIKEEERQYFLRQELEEKKEKLKEREKMAKERSIARQASEQAQTKARLEENKKLSERIKSEKKGREEKRLAEEILLREEKEREAKAEKRKERLRRELALAAEKRKIKRRKALRKFIKNFKIKLSVIFTAVKRNFTYGLLIAVVFLVVGYFVFCLAVLRFNFAGAEEWKLSNYLPVPAVLSNQGIIYFDDYRNLADENYYKQTLAEKKKDLAEWIAIRSLKRKYNLPLGAVEEELAMKFAFDEEINQVGLSRIKKISRLLAGEADMESLSKYADQYHEAAYYGPSQASDKFGAEILELQVGESSGIIFRGGGYYLAERINDQNNQFGYKYLYVSALTLERYLSEKSAQTKIFILAN